jgi:hypothetical protein
MVDGPFGIVLQHIRKLRNARKTDGCLPSTSAGILFAWQRAKHDRTYRPIPTCPRAQDRTLW